MKIYWASAHGFPPGCWQCPPPALAVSRWQWWLTANPACPLQAGPPLALRFRSPHVTEVFGQLAKAERMPGAMGRVRHAERPVCWWLCPVPGCRLVGDWWLRDVGALVTDWTQGGWTKRETVGGASAYHHQDGQIKTTCCYLVKFVWKAMVLFFPPHLIKQIWWYVLQTLRS